MTLLTRKFRIVRTGPSKGLVFVMEVPGEPSSSLAFMVTFGRKVHRSRLHPAPDGWRSLSDEELLDFHRKSEPVSEPGHSHAITQLEKTIAEWVPEGREDLAIAREQLASCKGLLVQVRMEYDELVRELESTYKELEIVNAELQARVASPPAQNSPP